MRKVILTIFICLAYSGIFSQSHFSVTVIPSSIRIDPVTNEIIENRYIVNKGNFTADILKKNWVYDGTKVSLKAARGEYVSFQVVVTNNGQNTLKGLQVE